MIWPNRLQRGQVKAIAATYQVTDGPNDQGEMFQRPGRPSDPIPGPFPNDQAARAANNGALPPDLSMIVKAREGGPDYVFAIVTGYKDPPSDFKCCTGMNYNEYFPGHQIAMPPPLADNAVTYADGTPATVPQMAHDVVSFPPGPQSRISTCAIASGSRSSCSCSSWSAIFYAAKRKIWAVVH